MPQGNDFVTERLRFRHLLLVRALATSHSVRKAAQALHISQSAATKLLRELERGLDARLFRRSAVGVSPTEQGLAFMRAASAMLAESHAAREELRAIEQGRHGEVRVGLFAIAATPAVTDAVVALRQSAPALAIRIEEGTAHGMLEAMRRGDLDCAIGRPGADGRPDLPRQAPRAERIALVVRRGHPLAAKRRVQLRDVVKAQWIFPTREALARQPLEAALAADGLRLPQYALESSAFLVNERLVRETDTVCPLPYALARTLQDDPRLCVLPITLRIPMRPVVLWTRHEPPHRPALQRFINAVSEAWEHHSASSLPVSALRQSVA